MATKKGLVAFSVRMEDGTKAVIKWNADIITSKNEDFSCPRQKSGKPASWLNVTKIQDDDGRIRDAIVLVLDDE